MQRYFDGVQWTEQYAPAAPAVAPPMVPPPAGGVVVSGPNHILHLILTVLTFWACGGWIWIWLIVALANNKRVQTVDAYGRVITPPPARPAGPAGPSFIDRVKAGDREDTLMWVSLGVAAAVVVIIAIVLIAAA